jgi:hypothetical protein
MGDYETKGVGCGAGVLNGGCLPGQAAQKT